METGCLCANETATGNLQPNPFSPPCSKTTRTKQPRISGFCFQICDAATNRRYLFFSSNFPFAFICPWRKASAQTQKKTCPEIPPCPFIRLTSAPLPFLLLLCLLFWVRRRRHTPECTTQNKSNPTSCVAALSLFKWTWEQKGKMNGPSPLP